MESLYKFTLTIYIIVVLSHKYVCGYCHEVFNPSQCAFEFFCENIFDLGEYSKDQYRFDTRPYLKVEPEKPCKTIKSENGWSINEFYPLRLHYRIQKTLIGTYVEIAAHDGFIPQLGRGADLLDLITNIDLSENNFDVVPDIREMKNLESLNLSKNYLTVAKLFNAVELPSLTEIDLSNNHISEIDHRFDHVYLKLKNIYLSNNNLINITEVFGPFKELEKLDVSHNYIDTLSPITFDGIKLLKFLNISHNIISDINSSMFRFNLLKVLDLSYNKIKTIKAKDLEKLINLESLDLKSNLLAVIEKDSFDNKPLLSSLYLNNNNLGNIDKDIFIHVSNLSSIDLSKNFLKKIPRGLFKNKNVKIFSITNNLLEDSIDKGTFEGLLFVRELNLSSQRLDSILDYAFHGLDHLAVLLLNNNNIKILSTKCFRMLNTLEQLDLSFNEIENIDFEKVDLSNLLSLSLHDNHIRVVKHEHFNGLNSLEFLDLSNNQISQIETNTFKSLKGLIHFEIWKNPLNGTLKESTFDGLNSIPSLDISHTLLTAIQNASFAGMLEVRNVNLSHSKIKILEYNVFSHTGAIKTIDLSFNELNEFNINSTELAELHTLFLNNNQIKTIDSTTFMYLSRLTKLTLSYNMMQNINVGIFIYQKYLRDLDVSYNLNLKFTLSLVNETKNLDILHLSGIKTSISFGNIKNVSLSKLIISNSSVSDVKILQINELERLDTLTLSFNDISRIEDGSFNNISNLRILDLSHNKIAAIQPGVFRDNTMLMTLNISHNFLTAISYGIFRGLIYLDTLDISYNKITDLRHERFNEVKTLSVLVADHNEIESINADEFVGANLTKLSIGGNPISCDVLAKLDVSFEITASRLYEDNEENVRGVTCNKKSRTFNEITNISAPNIDNLKVLLNIRDIMLDQFHNQQNISSSTPILANFNVTNTLLKRILQVITLNSTKLPSIQIGKDNGTYFNESFLSYVNKVREIEADMKVEQGRLNIMEAKISADNSHSHNNILLTTEKPRYEKVCASCDSKFTEICVVLILVILVGFILFKIYKSRIFLRQRFSISTRELPGAMDSAL